jgi:UPF0755 protein
VWKRLLVLAVLIVLAAAGSVVFWSQRAIQAPGPSTDPTRVVVERGSGVLRIALQLKQAGIIEHPRLFQVLAEWRGATGSLQAGEYMFSAGISLETVLERLAQGKTEIHFFTVAEGLTTDAVLQLLAAEAGFKGDMPDVVPEGSLLPATYDYHFGMERRVMVARMQAAMVDALRKAWEARDPDLPINSEQELLTLASIVERETGRSDERATVAGVFVNRLKRGMKLQSDPTTIYAVTNGKGPLSRGLRRSELSLEHPYNTYHIAGLPPGPIANPGKAALQAAARPAETDALFFVADGTGGHAFTRTLAEHNRNVARWREVERSRNAAE